VVITKRLVICGLARNIENPLPQKIIELEKIGSHFIDYRVVIFESDSTDRTRQKLMEWSSRNKKVILLDCVVPNCVFDNPRFSHTSYHKDRIDKMADYRNQYLDYVKKKLNNYDYMLVTDMDIIGNHDIDSFFTNFNKKNWDAIYINGNKNFFKIINYNYDPFAYLDIVSDKFVNDRKKNYNDTFEFFRVIDITLKTKYLPFDFIEVKSAFNGYGLFKIKSILDTTYSGNEKCEHHNLAKIIYLKGGKQFISKKWYCDIRSH